MCLWISDEPDILDRATAFELPTQFLLAYDEGQVPNKDGAREVFPWIDAGVAAAAWDLFVFTLLFC